MLLIPITIKISARYLSLSWEEFPDVHRDEVAVVPHAGIGAIVCLQKQCAAGIVTLEEHRNRWMRSGADKLSCRAGFQDVLARVIENPNSHTEQLALYLSRIDRKRRDSIHDYMLMI